MLFGLTPLGVFHTAVSLVAVAAGIIALIRDKQITSRNSVGKVYIVSTIIVCLTGFGIFQHGGFGKPHVLGIITLVVLGVAAIAGRTNYFGKSSRYIEVVSYSATFFFHMIPAVTETATRLPLGSPWIADRESPILQGIIGVFFVLFLIGATLQVRMLRSSTKEQSLGAIPGTH
ncbi:MAG: hypothetical protein QM703_22570 [Gemmatales bacterium]